MSDFRGLIVAVSGPSGVGKGTVLAKVEELLEKDNPGSVGHSISVTTRAPRGQEKDGVEYYFRTKEEFEQIFAQKTGFVKAMWCGDRACEDEIKEKMAVTSRCMPFEQEQISDTCVCCGKPAKHMVLWGKAY